MIRKIITGLASLLMLASNGLAQNQPGSDELIPVRHRLHRRGSATVNR